MDEWARKSLEDINNKLDRLDGRVDNIDVTMTRQQVILEEHQRRSLANEQAVEVLKSESSMIHGALKLIALVGVVATIASALIELGHLFKVFS